MSPEELKKRSGLLFRVTQLHYMIVDRNIELIDKVYPKASATNEFFNTVRRLDTLYTGELRGREREYFNAVKSMTTDKIEEHVIILEGKLKSLGGPLPEDQSDYIRYHSTEKIYHVDLYFNLNSTEIKMVFEIESVCEPDGGTALRHRIENRYPASSRVKYRERIKDDPVFYSGYYYYPEVFPTGVWTLIGTGYNQDNFVQSVIRTDAHRDVMTYEFQAEKKEGFLITQKRICKEIKTVNDSGYQIHGGGYTGGADFESDIYKPTDNNLYKDSTWGCIRMKNDDVREIISFIDAALTTGGRRLIHVE